MDFQHSSLIMFNLNTIPDVWLIMSWSLLLNNQEGYHPKDCRAWLGCDKPQERGQQRFPPAAYPLKVRQVL